MKTLEEIKTIIKETILIERLELEDITPEDIKDDMQLFGDGLGLDSVEGLEVVAGLEDLFNIKISLHGRNLDDILRDFYSVETIAAYVNRLLTMEKVNI